jgi:hypothetical protein
MKEDVYNRIQELPPTVGRLHRRGQDGAAQDGQL